MAEFFQDQVAHSFKDHAASVKNTQGIPAVLPSGQLLVVSGEW